MDVKAAEDLLKAIKEQKVFHIEASFEAGADPNEYFNGEHPLIEALKTINEENETTVQIIRLLLSGGAYPNLKSESIQPLYLAARKNLVKITELLLKYGAEKEKKSGNIWQKIFGQAKTPLQIAKKMKHQKIIEILTK